MTKLSPFETALRDMVRGYIREAIRDGTVAIGFDCLASCLNSKASRLEGYPKGTNAWYYFNQSLRNVCQEKDIAGFLC